MYRFILLILFSPCIVALADNFIRVALALVLIHPHLPTSILISPEHIEVSDGTTSPIWKSRPLIGTMAAISSIRTSGDRIEIIDQLLLPHTQEWIEIDAIEKAYEAIKSMKVCYTSRCSRPTYLASAIRPL